MSRGTSHPDGLPLTEFNFHPSGAHGPLVPKDPHNCRFPSLARLIIGMYNKEGLTGGSIAKSMAYFSGRGEAILRCWKSL
jgi:hypothetical protein